MTPPWSPRSSMPARMSPGSTAPIRTPLRGRGWPRASGQPLTGRGIRCSCRWICWGPSCAPAPSSMAYRWAGPASPGTRAVRSWLQPGSDSLTSTPWPSRRCARPRQGAQPRQGDPPSRFRSMGTGWLLEALVTKSPFTTPADASAHSCGDGLFPLSCLSYIGEKSPLQSVLSQRSRRAGPDIARARGSIDGRDCTTQRRLVAGGHVCAA